MRAKTALAGIFVASFILHPFYCDDLLEEADDTDDIRLLKTEERYKFIFVIIYSIIVWVLLLWKSFDY